MRCFIHQDRDAIGTCKHCYKGLCPDCLTDLGYGLACRNAHEQAVQDIDTLIARNRQAHRVAPKTWYVVPTFTLFMGLVFAGYGLFFRHGSSAFTTTLGLGFIVYAVALFVANYRAFKANDTQT